MSATRFVVAGPPPAAPRRGGDHRDHRRDRHPRHGRSDRFYANSTVAQWWLLDDAGAAVAFLQVIHHGDPARRGGQPRLLACDIEVRPDARGKGWARAIIAAVQGHYGLTLHTSGSYTPLGFATLSAHLPCVPGAAPTVAFEDMAFVADWDTRTTIHRL